MDMDATDCISNDTWQRYADGTLDKTGVALVHQHAAKCAICADMLEGIQHMEKPALLKNLIAEINSSVNIVSKPETFRVNPSWYAAAAILLITIGLGWYFLKSPLQQTIALKKADEEKTIQPEQEIVDSKDVPTEVSVPKKPTQAEPPVINQAPVATKKAITIEEAKALSNVEASMDISDASLANSERDLSVQKHPAKAETFTQSESPQHALQRITEAKKNKEEYPSPYINNNLRSISNSRSTSAMPDSVLYQMALVKYEAKQYDSCHIILLDVVMNPHSLYYEEGMLLLAKKQIAESEKALAIQSLQTVIGLNGIRKKEAEDLLNLLK